MGPAEHPEAPAIQRLRRKCFANDYQEGGSGPGQTQNAPTDFDGRCGRVSAPASTEQFDPRVGLWASFEYFLQLFGAAVVQWAVAH